MLNRRKFLGASAVVLGSAGCASQSPSASPEDTGDVPPSIARLQSMRDQATPISNEERISRVEKARQLMASHSLDAMLLTGGTSLIYFTGVQWGISERLFSVVIPRTGNAFSVCPAFEEGRAREQLSQGPLQGADILTWEEHQSPYALVAAGLQDRNIATGSLGIEETVRFVFVEGVSKAAPTLKIETATPVTAGCRGRKDSHELDLMRLASAVTLKAYEAAYLAMTEGMTQNEFRGLVSLAHDRLGFSGSAGVQVGENSALPHGSRTLQTIREGSILLIDGGCSAEGYRSDISRTFVLGRATDEMKQVFEIEHRAQTAALQAAKPGVEAQAVDAAARNVITEAMPGPDYKYFTHRVGHGIGMDGHEWPYLVRGNTLKLEPGMTFSDEPGIYQPGKFGVRLEDDMVITEDGAELFTPQSPSLEDPFGA